MKFVKYLISIFALWPLYWLSKLVPKKHNLWCISSYRDSLVDNSKYFYHHVSTQYPQIRCCWVTDNPVVLAQLQAQGTLVVKRKSLKGALTILRASHVFCSAYVSEVNFWLTGGAKVVNLWHGLPLKKIEFDIDAGELKDKYAKQLNITNIKARFFNPAAYRKPDWMFSPPSPAMQKIFASAFRVQSHQLVQCGSPRTDLFFHPEWFASLLKADYWTDYISSTARKIFIYMPTFRDTGGEFFASERFDFVLIEELMERLDGEFWIKAHPSAVSESLNLDAFKRVKLLPSNLDMYPLLAKSHALITDYSSIYIDYLLLDKPIFFYCFDLADYQATCRSMYFDYDEVTPGYKCQTLSELLQVLGEDKDPFSLQRKEVKTLFWGEGYNPACDALVKALSQ